MRETSLPVVKLQQNNLPSDVFKLCIPPLCTQVYGALFRASPAGYDCATCSSLSRSCVSLCCLGLSHIILMSLIHLCCCCCRRRCCYLSLLSFTVVIAVCSWYRAKVILRQGEQYSVQYVDFGNKEWRSSEHLRPLLREPQSEVSLVVLYLYL